MSTDNNKKRASSAKDFADVPWRRLHLWQIQPIRDLLLLATVFGLLWLGYKISLVTVPLLLALLFAYLFEPVVEWTTRKFDFVTRRMAAGGLIAVTAIVVIVPLSFAAVWGVAEGTRFTMRQAENAGHFVSYANALLKEPPGTEDQDENNAPNNAVVDGETPGNSESQPAEQESTGADPQTESEPDLVDGVDKANEEGEKAERVQEAKEKGLPPEISDDSDRPLTKEDHYDNLSSEAWRWAARTLKNKRDDPTVRRTVAFIGTMKPVPTMSQVRDYLAGVVSGIASSLSLIGVFGFQLFLTAFFFFFISSSYGQVIDFIENLLPEKHRDRTVDLAKKMDNVIAGFVRGRLIIALIQGVIFSVAYMLLGVPAAILLGFAVGLFSIVPYLALIGIPISILLLFLDGPESGFRSEWWFMLFAPMVVYFIVQALDDYVWTPLIQGKSTGLDTPTVLFASIAGGALAGFYGLLIAIPVAACVKILVQEVVWPRFKAWREGKVEDPLPLGGADGE